MLAGLPSQQKQSLYLQDAETYYYLNQVRPDHYSNKSLKNSKALLLDCFSLRGCSFWLQGWRLWDCWQKWWGGLPQAPQRHGNTSLQRRRPEQYLQDPVFHPPLRKCLLREIWGTMKLNLMDPAHLDFPHVAVFWCSFQRCHELSRMFFTHILADWISGSGISCERSGDPSGGWNSTDFPRGSTKVHYFQSHGKTKPAWQWIQY